MRPRIQSYSSALFIVWCLLYLGGCGGSSWTSPSTDIHYDIYHGYHHPHWYEDDDVYIHLDRDDLQVRKQQFRDKRPERRENINRARSRSSSMGRPMRGGRTRGGRR